MYLNIKMIQGGLSIGQGDLLRVLKSEDKWFTSKEIAEKMGVGIPCTLVKLKKLRNLNAVYSKKEGITYFYKYKEE